MFEVKSHFIGKFKIGDNINHNLRVLGLLYDYYEIEDDDSKNLLRKPIIVTIGSIIEAVLCDFCYRVKAHFNEGIKNVSSEVLIDIRSKKKLDKFAIYISISEKHELFGKKGLKIYESLHTVRKLRNRIHIQDMNDDFEKDEDDVFTEERKILAEKCLEKVVKTLSSKHGRSKGRHHTADFEFPWKEHLK